jgi:hypothetical protein
MDSEAKLNALKVAILPDTESNETLQFLLQMSESIVLNRMYPFGYDEGAQVPSRYEFVQIQIATELYSKRGTEGESSHDENGISRTYETGSVSNSLLRQIIPTCCNIVAVESEDSTTEVFRVAK